MMRSSMFHVSVFSSSLASALLMLAFGGPNVASAQLEACGDIHVEANANCEVMVEGGCTTMCEPLNFTASCAADLQVGCEGGCNVEEERTCVDNCDITVCETECMGGSFNCQASCTANIGANCSARCEGMAGDGMARARCEASCEATFSAECNAGCSVTLPTCTETCTDICVRQCRSEVNVDCQISCQADGYIDCETSLTGGCMTACTEPDGALFCDGQYVDHNGNLDSCITAIENALDVSVDVSARGSAACDGGTCTAEGEVEVGCAAMPGNPGSPYLPLGLGLFVGLIALRRRTR